jgi:hypothetical protein
LVYDYAGVPFYCPPVVVRIAAKNSPALQAVDFLLWSCARALSDRSGDVWVRRSESKLRISIRRGQGPITYGTLYLDWPSPAAVHYLSGIDRGKLAPWQLYRSGRSCGTNCRPDAELFPPRHRRTAVRKSTRSLRQRQVELSIEALRVESLGTVAHERAIDLRNLGRSSHSHHGGQFRSQNLDNPHHARLSERG